jgi:hypothetical protein
MHFCIFPIKFRISKHQKLLILLFNLENVNNLMNPFKNLFVQCVAVAASAMILAGCSGQNGGESETDSEGMEQEQQAQDGQQQSGQQQGGQQGQDSPMSGMQQQQSVDIDVSEEELKKFAQVAQKVQAVQQGAQQEMIDSVESTGLTLDEYNKIASQQRGQGPGGAGGSGDGADVSDEKKAQFEEANQKISDMQSGVRDQVNQTIEDAGMDPERFQKIGRALRSDKELQKRFQQIRQQQGGGPGGGMRRQGGGGGR